MALVLIVGDGSNHDGNIIESGAPRTTIGGIHVAYVGSPVSGDAEQHSPNEIVSSGSANRTTVGGIPVACVGAGTACGATYPGSAQGRTTL